MTNLEFYKKEIQEKYFAFAMRLKHSKGRYDLADAIYEVCRKPKGKKFILDWFLEEHKEPILDEVEKKYLRAVIRPFKNKKEVVITIIKVDMRGVENLEINIKRDYDFETTLYFPPFEKDTMYKGMELGKEYILEELGL